MTTNKELAARLNTEADAASVRRRALLTAAVALTETSTVAAARKLLVGYDGPAEVVSAALAVINGLTVGTGITAADPGSDVPC